MIPSKTLFIAILVLFLNSIGKANDVIQINKNQYFIDVDKNLIITNTDVALVNSTCTNTKTHVRLNETCKFLTPVTTVETGIGYPVFIPSCNAFFTLYFTQLPIISITTNETIVDEPNVLAYFKMIETNQNYLESYIGIQYRGGWSQSNPKKSMEIEFWFDPSGALTRDYSLLGMVNDDDWNLQAMYNEPIRIRSKVNNDLWPMINTLHYKNQEPKAINGVRMKYVELFINNEYRGLYCLGEKVNRKQLKLKKYNGNIRGELYKGKDWAEAVTFDGAPAYNNNSLIWSGFEYKHPDEDINWSNLYQLANFVVNSSNHNFYEEYKNKFELDNLVDYYIFMNLLSAIDNTGKNIYIAKYDTNTRYFYMPWDLDGTFGIIWDGTYNSNTFGLLSNGLYERLKNDCSPNGFNEKLKNKWVELRSTVITHDSLMSIFTANHNYLESNGVYIRESLAWADYSNNIQELSYISEWITNRIAYLDLKFSEECIPITTDDIDIKSEMVSIYPNPTNDLIFIKSNLLQSYQITVYDNFGQVILQELFHDSDEVISLGNLNRGLYFIKVENNNYSKIHKLILIE